MSLKSDGCACQRDILELSAGPNHNLNLNPNLNLILNLNLLLIS
jgi:hypothetical protein